MKNIKSYLLTGAIAIVAVMLYNKFLAPRTGVSA